MIPHGRRAFWLTSAVIALLVWEGMRTRWRRVVAAVTAIAFIRRPVMCANHQRGCADLTAEDKRRLAGRAGREENHGDAGG